MTQDITAQALDGRILLQTIVTPDPDICGEDELFFHREPGVTLRSGTGALAFRQDARAGTDTYMNLFNLGTWSRACRLHGLTLRLAGSGRFALRVTLLGGSGDVLWLFEDLVTLDPGGIEIDLGAMLGPRPDGGPAAPREGLAHLRLTALEDEAELTSGALLAPCPDPAEVRLAIAVTTFRREAEVARTAARIAGFLDAAAPWLGAQVHLFVIDNGGTAAPAPHPRLTMLANPNLGGAGGFARGLAAALDGGFSHCLFMDDDASIQMESLVRTLAVLRLARSPQAAVAGAMISEARRWAMWENGAVFSGACRPMFVGTNLRNAAAVAAMEIAAARPKPAGFYAGWWFFAFPVAAVRRFPFPFFVRGDDISFSLANRFDTVTLNGVVSFQEDFSAKESPLTLYLDLRNHLHHHLVHPALEIGALGTARIALRFIGRSIVRMHYDSAEAQLAAWADVMKGPDFFAANAGMAERRPQISALARTEAWRPMDAPPPGAVPPSPARWRAQAAKLTLNGHLVPLWRLIAGSADIPADHRGLIWPLWGKARARFHDVSGSRGYEVRHDKARFARIAGRALVMAWRWRAAYPALREAHRAAYPALADRGFWQARFAPPASDPAPDPAPAAG